MLIILFHFYAIPEFLAFGEEIMILGKDDKIHNSRARWLQSRKKSFELEPFNRPAFLKGFNTATSKFSTFSYTIKGVNRTIVYFNKKNTPLNYALSFIHEFGWSDFIKTHLNLSNENLIEKLEDVKQFLDFMMTILQE